MHIDEIVINVITKVALEYPGINANKLRGILEETLYDYDIQIKSKELSVVVDMQERIIMYLATKKLDGLSSKTLKNYGLHLRRFANYIYKDVKDVTTMDIRMFLADLVKSRNLKNSSLEGEKTMLKSFFSWLEDEDYIVKSPAKKIKATKIEKRIRKHLTAEELELLRDACKNTRQRAVLELLFSTGGRVSEIHDMNVRDINWSESSITVIGKGNKQREILFSPKAKIYLKKYLLERGISSNDALIISSKKPFGRLGVRSIEREIDKIAEQAGFKKTEKSVYPHLLRHTFGSLGLQSGMPLPVLQELMGHESMDTTTIYAQLDKENIKHEYRKHLAQ